MKLRYLLGAAIVAAVSASIGYVTGSVNESAKQQVDHVRLDWLAGYHSLVNNEGNSKSADAIKLSVGIAMMTQTYALGHNFSHLSEDEVRSIKEKLPKLRTLTTSAYAENFHASSDCIKSAEVGHNIYECILAAIKTSPKEITANL